ncbi:Rz1-like lysis system protein LysC [Iodobacter ciconiae]|uniref:Rz1-like lysis system protein LysC n=1 Tax=Iodobacter ciconiae TaxID=2496266 RepID=UPI003571067D
MKAKKSGIGLILACLLMLSACASAPISPVPQLIGIGCPSVTACRLPASQAQTNGELNQAIDDLEAAWHSCAAQIDMVLQCQQAAKATP